MLWSDLYSLFAFIVWPMNEVTNTKMTLSRQKFSPLHTPIQGDVVVLVCAALKSLFIWTVIGNLLQRPQNLIGEMTLWSIGIVRCAFMSFGDPLSRH